MAKVNKVSVIVPTYNAAALLPATIHSILTQSYKDLEVIVVDDGSSDDTARVVGQFGNKVEYIRLRTFSGALGRPRNIGIKAASGDYIAPFDAGDLMTGGKLKEQAEFLNDQRDVPLVFSDFRLFEDEAEDEREFLSAHRDFQTMPKAALEKNWFRLESKDAYETLIADNFIGASSAMFRTSIIDEVGYFDQGLVRSEDIDLWLKIARRADIGFIDKVLYLKRKRPQPETLSPVALKAKLSIYERQRSYPMSPHLRQTLDASTAKLMFSIGHSAKIKGDRLEAIRFYVNSLRYKRTDYRIFLSILRALLPL